MKWKWCAAYLCFDSWSAQYAAALDTCPRATREQCARPGAIRRALDFVMLGELGELGEPMPSGTPCPPAPKRRV